MKVILLRDVPTLGPAGSLVDVKEGYARNFLFPQGLAREATGGAMRAREEVARSGRERRAREQKDVERVAQALQGLILEVPVRSGTEGRLFGAVTAQQVAEVLQRRGFAVTKKQVELPHPIRVEGFHRVAVRLATGRVAHVDVNVIGMK